jgi:hypothetical protein
MTGSKNKYGLPEIGTFCWQFCTILKEMIRYLRNKEGMPS